MNYQIIYGKMFSSKFMIIMTYLKKIKIYKQFSVNYPIISYLSIINQKEIIYNIDKIVNEVNIIQSGYVDIINYKVMLKKRLKQGDGIGVFYILYKVRPIYAYIAASGVEVISISEENFLKVLNKEDPMYYRKFKNVSMTRFKEIFHQINSSKKKKKYLFDKYDNKIMNKKKDIKKNKELKEYELDYQEIKKNFNKLVNSDDYLLRNIYQNESLTNDYKNSFKLEEAIIDRLNEINNK